MRLHWLDLGLFYMHNRLHKFHLIQSFSGVYFLAAQSQSYLHYPARSQNVIDTDKLFSKRHLVA